MEDHLESRMALARLLTLPGYELTAVGDCGQAKAQISQENFDLVISDIGLPDDDGYSLMRWAKGLRPHLLAIALTALGSERDLRKSSEAGFIRHLLKPVNFSTLRQAIRDALSPASARGEMSASASC